MKPENEIKHFGGLGGIQGGRPFNPEDEFEAAVEEVLGDTMRADRSLRTDMWSALANQGWKHADGHTANYSFRAAGDLIAAICDDGTNYMDYYCSGDYPYVAERISTPLAAKGWTPDDEDNEQG